MSACFQTFACPPLPNVGSRTAADPVVHLNNRFLSRRGTPCEISIAAGGSFSARTAWMDAVTARATIRRWFVTAAILFASASSALAATTSRVIDLAASPGVTQRILYVHPEVSIATIVALPGGDGILGIANDGSVAVPCFPLYRTRQQLADMGIAVALVDAASDQSVYGPANVTAVIDWVRAQADVPVWVVGGSASTNPAADIINALPADAPIGAVFFSADKPVKRIINAVSRPTLVVFDSADIAQAASLFYAALTAAPIKQLVALSGGDNADCGFHLFQGLDDDFAHAVGSFIQEHNADTGAGDSFNPNQGGLSGSWANPATDSQGFVLDVASNFYGEGRALIFGGWFTYDVGATGGLRWYTIQGKLGPSNAATMGIYRSLGGRFDSTQATRIETVGTTTVRFEDCSHGSLDYRFDDGRQGTIPLTRLLANSTCSAGGADEPPRQQADNAAWSGAWADVAANSGQGLVMEFNPVQNLMFAAWYTFGAHAGVDDDARSQDWYTLQAQAPAGVNAFTDIGIYATSGGVFDQHATTSIARVGSADLTFHSCTSATLDYRFSSGANAGRAGMLHLTRLSPAADDCHLWPSP